MGCANGAGVTGVTGTATGVTVGVGGAGPDEVYVASKPRPFTDPSDEKTTVSWPLGDVTVTPDLVPVIDSASGADAEAPLYTLTKS